MLFIGIILGLVRFGLIDRKALHLLFESLEMILKIISRIGD